MRRLCCAVRAVVIRNHFAAIRDNQLGQHSPEVLQTGYRLVVRRLVTCLIQPREREVAILAGLTVLCTINQEGGVARSAELLGVCVVDGEGDGLTAKPVANVVCVAVDEGNADTVPENLFKIFDEVGVYEVTGVLETLSYVGAAGSGVVDVYPKRLLCALHVQELDKVVGRSGVVEWVADVVNTAAAICVVWLFDHGSAEIGGLRTLKLACFGGAVAFFAVTNLVVAAIGNIVRITHEFVHCVVYSLDAVGVVDGKFGVVGCLNVCAIVSKMNSD
jgi:hypothetical protein